MSITSVNQQHRGPAPAGGRRVRSASRAHHAIRWLGASLVLAAALALGPAGVAQAAGFKSVTTGNFHSCALRGDDTLVCWGMNNFGQANAPAGSFKSVSAGSNHTCAVKADDTLACWGFSLFGQTNAPAGSFKSVSAGGVHNCAVKPDDTLACWGDNFYGQTNAPAGAFKSVSAGGNHSCAVKPDDTLVCWGRNNTGQINAPAGAFKSVDGGSGHSCAVKADDTLTCWGDNGRGETNAPAGAFKSVDAGGGSSCGVKADDTLTCWGDGDDGETNVPAGAFKSVSVGGDHNCGVRADDTLACWGFNGYGQTNAPVDLPPDDTAPVIAPTVTGTLGDNGWYTTNVYLTWSVTDAESAITNRTGCDAVDVTADQQATSYTCTATSTGGTASETVSIKRDAHAPDVTVTGVSDGATYTAGSVPTAGCDTQDSTSGVANAATLSTTGGPFGVVTKTCSGASDNAGNTASASATYNVQYAFTGFFAPIDNGNVLNEMNAGRAVPVKFSLGGNQGLDILAAGSPSSQQIACDSSLPVGAVEETTSAGSSSLSYDAGSDRYEYVWTTDSAWAGTCRQLNVTLNDGSTHTAKFKFR